MKAKVLISLILYLFFMSSKLYSQTDKDIVIAKSGQEFPVFKIYGIEEGNLIYKLSPNSDKAKIDTTLINFFVMGGDSISVSVYNSLTNLSTITEGKANNLKSENFYNKELFKTRVLLGNSPGDELISSGKMMLTGTAITFGGSLLGTFIAYNSESYAGEDIGNAITLLSSVTGVILNVLGVNKLIKSGKKFNLLLGQQGLGASITF